MDATAALTLAVSIVDAIIKVAPAVEQGIVDSLPYAQAIAGLIKGTNATQAEIDQLLAAANIESDQFDTPLPPDDGTTTG
jgi:hypothetical protein